MFCAGLSSSNACLGDSGGPAIAGEKLIGIVSVSSGCNHVNLPTIYTRIHVFYDWIANNTGIENL